MDIHGKASGHFRIDGAVEVTDIDIPWNGKRYVILSYFDGVGYQTMKLYVGDRLNLVYNVPVVTSLPKKPTLKEPLQVIKEELE